MVGDGQRDTETHKFVGKEVQVKKSQEQKPEAGNTVGRSTLICN